MEEELSLFVLLFMLFGGTLLSLLLLHRFKLPALIGYVATGVLIGPEGYNLLSTTSDTAVSAIAELGVMSLMFFIGLKFSFSQLRALRRHVLRFGSSQVAACLAIPFCLYYFLIAEDWYAALTIGAMVAMSSTAVVSELLISRSEVHSPHGSRAIAVLLFQDIAVIPLIIVLSAQAGEFTAASASVTAVSIVAVLFGLLYVAPRLLPRFVSIVAATQSNEMLTIAILTLVTGLALITHYAGLSLILGAFLAGMLLAESTLRYRIEELTKPFKELLLGFFFISIGMLIEIDVLYENIIYILAITCALLAFKPLMVYMGAKISGTKHLTAVRVSLLLGGTGEFGFVLLTEAARNLDSQLLDILIGVNLLGMIAVPLLVPHMARIERLFAGKDWMFESHNLMRAANATAGIRDHVIIIGFGRSGQMVGRILKNVGVPWTAIESDYERYRAASQAGEQVVYGDARDREMLIATGLLNARAVIVAHQFHGMAVRNIEAVRGIHPDIPIIGKVYSPGELDDLRNAGANFVLVASLSTGATMAEQTMHFLSVPEEKIREQMKKAKADSQKTTGFFAGIDFENDSPSLYSFALADDSAAVSMTAGEIAEMLGLKSLETSIEAVRRDGQEISLNEDPVLATGDVVVLTARPSQAERIENILHSGSG